ncbi:hypothetical protein CCR75_007706 [Bremia lactucae]|uniref:Uncharacterized protein n=1 Tax=Bremia lactucae TaxID=4779 RepID=A0A976IEZ7_BRELC|nr:hypothetical protein CCR75_007706 [Bremia lactucae]
MKVDTPRNPAISSKKKEENFDEVDKRIQIPVATRLKMEMNVKMNVNSNNSLNEDTRLLRTGINQYRNLQHLNTAPTARRFSGSAERATERGVSLMERKQYGAAIPFFTEAIETLSSSELSTVSSIVKLFHQRGLCYLAVKKYKCAIQDLSRVMQMTPKSSELFAKRGKAYAALGEHHAAMLDYNEAISLVATQGLLHDYKGMIMQSDGLSSRLVQLRSLYLARAKVYKAMNNISHALEDLCHAEHSAGGHRDVELFYERAQLYLHCHQDSLALQDFDRFLELQDEAEESRHFDASGGVGGLAGFVAPPDSELTTRVLDVFLERAKLLQRMAFEEYARERKDAELAAVEQGQATRTGKVKVTTGVHGAVTPTPYRGIESRRLENRALEDYSKALDIDATNVETLRLHGESLMHLGRYDEALADFKRALQEDPLDFTVSMARANLYRQRGDLQAAIDEVSAVLRVNGFFINGLKLRAQLYEESGAIQEAENDYSSIIHAHYDKSEAETASTGNVTLELASGGTWHVSAYGKGKHEKAGGKITSEVAAQALLCRARIRLVREQFDAAEEDYQTILSSFANNMEAQLELQETRERRVMLTQRKQREALAWLEQNADATDGVNVNGNVSGSKSKRKKRKKKKKTTSLQPSASERPPAGYVLLEDDEEELLKTEQEEKALSSQETGEGEGTETMTIIDCDEVKRLSEPVPDKTSDTEKKMRDTKQGSDHISTVSYEVSSGCERPRPIVVTNVMTRDEAWDSMWDEEAEEIAVSDFKGMTTSPQSVDVLSRNKEISLSDKKTFCQEVENPSSCCNVENAPVIEKINDEASGSSEDGKDPSNQPKTVLMDEKYLKKRKRQLKKLRAILQHASDERDKDAINEALARAERKQMSAALYDDIQRAHNVLNDLAAAEDQRSHDCLEPLSNENVASLTSPIKLSKSPSLAIRPIAYGQALQAAEQQQQQLKICQKLLEEKEAEIISLRRLVAQTESCVQEDVTSKEARSQAKAAGLASYVIQLRTQFPVQKACARQAEALIEWIGPSDTADSVRQQVLSFVQRIITAQFPLAAAPLFFATGSYPMKTYLPGSDLDICLLVPQALETSWYYIVMQALCVAGGSGGAGTVLDLGHMGRSGEASGTSSPSAPHTASGSSSGSLLLTNTVRNVTFINADVRVVKCTIDNISVDLTANRVGALGAVRLLDAMSTRVGRKNLFKKSLILIKAWCAHESSSFVQTATAETGGLNIPLGLSSLPQTVMGASHGGFSTYAVNTIVMALFNEHGDALIHPLQALYLFLDRLAEFPWHESALSLHGAVSLCRLATMPANEYTHFKYKPHCAKLDAKDIEAIRDALCDEFGAFDAMLTSQKGNSFPVRVCNIVDPLDEKNNLARSVSAEGFPVLKRAFRLARDQLAALLKNNLEPGSAHLLDEDGSKVFFAQCWHLYGRGDGWRPDLLTHPRQTWHGMALSSSIKKNKTTSRHPATSALGTIDEDEGRRWESLLPSVDASAMNALLFQHQQLQQQAVAAAAYHHGSTIAYQQPYYNPLQHTPSSPQPSGVPTRTIDNVA